DINGGICYLHYDKTFFGESLFTDGKNTEKLYLDEFDIITDDPKGYSLVRKILKEWEGDFVSSVAWARKPFGLPTNHNDWIKKESSSAIPCLSRNKEIKYVDRKIIKKNVDKID